MKYTKPPLDLDKQINNLISKNLIISDINKAKNYLSNINYYRFSGYSYHFLDKSNDRFRDNVTFDDVLGLYLFDREFRMLIFDAIERIEISFRTQIIYHFSLEFGSNWYENKEIFYDHDLYDEHLSKLKEEIGRSTEVFIDHFKTKYFESENPPAWMTFEVISIGLLSKIYRNLSNSETKKRVSKHYKLDKIEIFQSWMQSISYVRNICAHHGRLWNRILTIKPINIKNIDTWVEDKTYKNDKIYYFLCTILYLLKSINPNTKFAAQLKELFDKYPKIPTRNMGFTPYWKEEVFWK
ncbi:MAG: Abi family protein [Cytophagales bacterium]|nr:MAG: Abi family protein [Cytophagales bacterium]